MTAAAAQLTSADAAELEAVTPGSESRGTGSRAAALDALSVRGLRKEIDDRVVLRDLNFAIARGAFVALLGANGAGKSTLLKVLAGLIAPTSGDIAIFDRPMTAESSAIRSRIGFIGHSPMLYRDLTARENLEFFGRMQRLPKHAARDRAADLLEAVSLAGRADDPVKTFSRGMTQRVAIARALLCDPDLLLADEPFSGLDVPSCSALESILARLHEQGKTVVLANHDVSQSLSLAQRVLVMRGGALALDDSTAALSRDRCEEFIT